MKSPFKFLDSYTKDDREIFFGRDREIEELYHRVFESKIMLVYGVSGTGKSSLIHCGLANKFQDTDWLPIVIRRGGNIIESMAAGIKSASITEQQSKLVTSADFKKSVRSLYLDHYKPVFFIFDQFEELFIFGDKEERRAFIQIVKSLVESELQCRFIFVMREEYMAWVTEFEKIISTFFSNRVRIEKMSHSNALEAINGPCNAFNISLEDGFAENLLEKLSPGETDVELTYLQVFLDKIFRLAAEILPPPGGESKGGSSSATESNEKLTFTLGLLNKTGNVSDLLGNFLEEQISLMENPDTALSVLKAFISGKGTKRPANEPEVIDNIRSFGKEIPSEKVTELIQSFVKLRVLRDKDNNGRYELRHDALAEKIYDKFSTAEKELLEIRQFIENSYQSYLKRKILLNNDDLEYISKKDSLLNLNSELKGFLEESRKLQKAKIRTVRRLTAISALSFLLLICILLYYILIKITQTNADYLAIKSMSLSSDPINRFKKAGEAWEKNNGAITKEALIKAFNNILSSPEKDSVMLSIAGELNVEFDPAPINIQYAECSKDNKYIYGYGDSLLFIWNLRGKLENIIRTRHFPLVSIKMSPDSRFIGAVSCDSILTIWDIQGATKFSDKIQYNVVNARQIFKFVRENNILSLHIGHDAVLYNIEGKILQTFDRHKARVNAIDSSPDNNFIATASCDSTINIWYFNSVKERFDFYNTLNWHHDTVWSVSFANKYLNVVSTSSDKNCIIGNINNQELFQESSYYKYKILGSCYAELTASDRGIIGISYSFKNKEANGLFYAANWNNPKHLIDNREGEDFYENPSKFSFLTFSGNENYYACSEKDKVYLVDNKLAVEKDRFRISSTYTLMEFTGNNPFFTPDSKYFIYVYQNRIIANFIDMEVISNLSGKFMK